MIADLVMYLLRQGEYNSRGDIAVLCSYLGQLQRVRAALRPLGIAVAVDKCDGNQVTRQESHGEDEALSVKEVTTARHVRLVAVNG